MGLPTTLPASWYTSDQFLKVAQEKIFDKGWHFISPIVRFVKDQEDGEKVCQFNLLGNPFFVLDDIEDVYDVQEIDAYYGNYEDHLTSVETKEELQQVLQTLKKVNTHVTPSGLLFVCHESQPPDFGEYYGNQLEQFIGNQDFKNRPLRRKLVYECDYGFITFIDGYQECLHCTYTHPALSKAFAMDFYKVETYTNFCRHLAECTNGDPSVTEPGLFLYFFPTCSLNCYAGGMGIFRCCPLTGSKCRMEFDYFFEGSDEDFEKYFSFARQVAIEDIELCESCQNNLESGMYQVGTLNPENEKGVVYYQQLIKDRVTVA